MKSSHKDSILKKIHNSQELIISFLWTRLLKSNQNIMSLNITATQTHQKNTLRLTNRVLPNVTIDQLKMSMEKHQSQNW